MLSACPISLLSISILVIQIFLSSFLSSLVSQNDHIEPLSHSWSPGAPTFFLEPKNVLGG